MTWASNWSGTYPVRASVSYVTGSHTSKFGFVHTFYTTDDDGMDPQGISYRFNNGVPNQLTLSNAAADDPRAAHDAARSSRRIRGCSAS